MILQLDGRSLVCGDSYSGTNLNFMVWRFKTGCFLDISFPVGDDDLEGVIVWDQGSNYSEQCQGLFVDGSEGISPVSGAMRLETGFLW